MTIQELKADNQEQKKRRNIWKFKLMNWKPKVTTRTSETCVGASMT